MDKNAVLSAIQRELSYVDAEEAEAGMATALDYYDGNLPEATDDTVEFSEVVSRDIQNAVEATVAEIMPGFASDRPASFLPFGEADEQQAEIESQAVNWVIMTISQGYVLLNRACKDALMFGNGMIKVSWDSSQVPVSQRINGIPPEVLPTVLDGAQHYQVEEDEDGLYTADVVTYRHNSRPLIEWIPLEEVLVNKDHLDANLDTARFVCHRRQMTASDLIAAGAPRDLVDDLAGSDFSTHRLRSSDDTSLETETGHESTRMIMVAESYYRLDEDGDGMAELRRIVTAGGADGDSELIMDEPWDSQPFCNGVAFFSPRTWRGVTLTERLKDVQDTKTDLIRQVLDSGWRNLQQRIGAVESLVNMDDLLQSVKGGVVRMKDPGAVVPLPNIEPPQSALAMLEVTDKMRRESGGAAIDTAAQAQQVSGDTAHGIERMMTAIEQCVAVAARNLAETMVKPLYSKTHSLLRRYWQQAIPLRQKTGWQQAIPQAWPERSDVAVSVGLSVGERTRLAGIIMGIVQQQQAMLGAGLKVATPQHVYNALVDYGRLSGLHAPEQYWLDPASPEAQQLAQQEAQATQQAEQAKFGQQMELAKQQAQAALLIENMKSRMKEYEIEMAHVKAVNDEFLKLIDMNAKYEGEPVPDTMPGQTDYGNSKEDDAD